MTSPKLLQAIGTETSTHGQTAELLLDVIIDLT